MNRFWLSGSDQASEGNWVWKNTGQPVSGNMWRPGQPDNAGGKEHCNEIHLDKLDWNDCICASHRAVICEVVF